MSAAFERVKAFLETAGLADRIRLPEGSSATVELAAQALGCRPEHIAKSLSFNLAAGPVVIVVAGDAKVDNHRYKMAFHEKAHKIPAADVERLTGHVPGGVCPFALKDGVTLYFDESLKRFTTIFPAAGEDHTAVELTVSEMEAAAKPAGWVDVCKAWRPEEKTAPSI